MSPTEQADNTPIPRPDRVDAAWLNMMLLQSDVASEVADVAIAPVGTGQLGDTVRLTLSGASGGDLPSSMIGKFAAGDQGSRDIAAAWNLYEREVNFYRQLAPAARIATPQVYATALNADGSFALLLQDLATARVGNQFAGLDLAEAELAVKEAARLHAAFWDFDGEAELGWLESGKLAQPFYDAGVLRGAWPAFRDRYANMLSSDMKRVCDRLTERYERYMRPLSRPRCVTHNDYRPDNMLFAIDGKQFTVDWQSVAFGYNAVDVSYLIGGTYEPAQRRYAEGRLLETYLAELERQGVEGYGMAELTDDYRHFSFAGINVAVGAAMMVKRTERGDRMFLTMLERHVAHVVDTGALSILD